MEMPLLDAFSDSIDAQQLRVLSVLEGRQDVWEFWLRGWKRGNSL